MYKTGDVLDNFGEIWTIAKIDKTGRKITIERTVRADMFGKTFVESVQRHPRDLDHMRKVES